MKRPASCGQVDLVAAPDDFLARTPAVRLRQVGRRLVEARERLELVEESARRILREREERREALRELRQRLGFERQRRARLGAEEVDGHGDLVAADVFEEQGGAAGLGDAVGDFGDLQILRDLGADAAEFAARVERFEEVAEVAVGHAGSLSRESERGQRNPNSQRGMAAAKSQISGCPREVLSIKHQTEQ